MWRSVQSLQERDSSQRGRGAVEGEASNVISIQRKDPSKKTLKQRGNAFPASKSIHIKAQPSPLSIHAKQQNYRGFFNLGVIILMMSHFRVIMDNILEYGLFLTNMSSSGGGTSQQWDSPRPLQVTASWALGILTVFGIEKLAERGSLSDGATLALQGFVSMASVVGACLWVWHSKSHPGLCMLYLMQSVILWMKLISYVHCNR